MGVVLKAYGKFILAGEHTVLRGGSALVFPVKSQFLEVGWVKTEEPLQVEFQGPHAKEIKLIFWGVVEQALKDLGHTRDDLRGELKFVCEIPLGAGLGASATLCVAVGKWFCQLGWINKTDIYEFARNLENLFHGESSGVDIAAALEGQGLRFFRGGERVPLKINWQPQFYLSFCGHKGMTSECVDTVKALHTTHPEEAKKIDEQMLKAVQLAELALSLEAKEGLPRLIESMNLSKNCFEQWSLTKGALGEHMSELLDNGALAVKPTGSGGGGFVLSLWDKTPSSTMLKQMIQP